jgi:hypothetical protein
VASSSSCYRKIHHLCSKNKGRSDPGKRYLPITKFTTGVTDPSRHRYERNHRSYDGDRRFQKPIWSMHGNVSHFSEP